MKKAILVLLALPLILVSCSEKGDDSNIQGTWYGTVKISDLQTLGFSREALQANKSLSTETMVYKFEDRKIETYKSRDADINTNEVEKEIGSYKAEDNTLEIVIEAHSCANLELVPRKLQRTATYTLSEDFSKMTLSFGVNKKIVLTKVEAQEESNLNNSLSGADVGCFVKETGKPISFKENDVQKPINP